MKIYNVSELNIEAREAILASFEYPISVKGELLITEHLEVINILNSETLQVDQL